MELASLNKAHQQERRAEALLTQNKFEECIECHKNAILYLMDSMSCTDNEKALESLKLQKIYHARQIDIVRMKQRQHDKIQIRKTLNRNNSNSSLDFDSDCAEETLKTAIFHNIVVQDSLIDRLERRHNVNNYDSFSTSDTDEKSTICYKIDDVSNTIGNKHPKDDSTTIEELRILRSQLQDLVQTLVTQLDQRNKEIEQLKQRIKELETDQNKGSSKNNSLKVVTDSSGGTSPYVLSPCSELSPDVNEIDSLPSLTSLDLPKYDYKNVYKSHSAATNNINNN